MSDIICTVHRLLLWKEAAPLLGRINIKLTARKLDTFIGIQRNTLERMHTGHRSYVHCPWEDSCGHDRLNPVSLHCVLPLGVCVIAPIVHRDMPPFLPHKWAFEVIKHIDVYVDLTVSEGIIKRADLLPAEKLKSIAQEALRVYSDLVGLNGA